MFPPGHPVREAISREPDFLPESAGIAKLETYARIVLAWRKAQVHSDERAIAPR